MSAEVVIPEPCAECGEPAIEQVYVGTRFTPGEDPKRRYAWMCDLDALVAERERKESING